MTAHCRNLHIYKMAASSKDKRTAITTPPYKVPIVDATLDPPTFSLETTFIKYTYFVCTFCVLWFIAPCTHAL